MSAASFWEAVARGALARRICGEFRTPPPVPPAARAATVRGWSHLTPAQAREFDWIVAHLKAGDKKAGEVA